MKRILLPFLILFTLISVVALLGVLNSTPLHAADEATYVPLAPLPGVDAEAEATLESYLPAIFQLSIGIAGVLAVIMLILGGLQYMGSETVGGKQDGRDRITAALGGLLLALAAFLILQTINKDLVNFSLDIAVVEVEVEEPPDSDPGDPPRIVPERSPCDTISRNEVCEDGTQCVSVIKYHSKDKCWEVDLGGKGICMKPKDFCTIEIQ